MTETTPEAAAARVTLRRAIGLINGLGLAIVARRWRRWKQHQ